MRPRRYLVEMLNTTRQSVMYKTDNSAGEWGSGDIFFFYKKNKQTFLVWHINVFLSRATFKP